MIAMRAKLPELRRGSAAFEALVVATTAAITAGVTYKIASDRVEARFAARMEDEIDAMKKFYAAVQEKPSLDDLVAVVPVDQQEMTLPLGEAEATEEELEQLRKDRQEAREDPRPSFGHPGGRGLLVDYHKVATETVEDPEEVDNEDPTDVPIVHNVFDGEATESLPPHLVDARDPDEPYLITLEEFTEGENNSDTFTYYAEDGVLAGSDDMPVDDVAGLVGTTFQDSFGLGSGDRRVVYIRNENIDMDFEICLHNSSYAKVVAGMDDTPEPRRRRTPKEE